MKQHYLRLVCLLLVITGITSCKKYLDRTPLDTITSEAFYLNQQQVNQALTGVYNAFGARTISPGYTNPTPYYSKLDLYTELGLERGLNGTIGSGAYNSLNGAVVELWGGFYQVVQRANNMLYFMTRAEATMSPADYNRYRAEAKVLRGLAYWHLIMLYGDVPFYTSPLDKQDAVSLKKTPKKETIDFLLTDLNEAAASLDWLPTAAGRVSRGVALGTAARLAMLDERYATVISLTDNIIANGPYNLNPVFQNLFRKAGQTANVNNEVMFYYPFGDADAGSYNYLNLVLGSRAQGGQSSHFPAQFLVDLFECIDGKTIDQSPLYDPAKPNQNRDPRMRQTVMVPGDTSIVQGFTSIVFAPNDQFLYSYNTTTGVVTKTTTANQDSVNIFGPRLNGGGNLWKKYAQDRDINGTAGNTYRVGWVYMRFAEILLLNAEAKLENGSSASDVATPVNRVRRRAGMPDVAADVLGNPGRLKQLVRREKTLEFAEEGIHIADMRRWDDGAYALKVMATQIYGQPLSNMTLIPGVGLVFNRPAPPPVFDPVYNVPVSWPNADALRSKRELRIFNVNQHILLPLPQSDVDNSSLDQNPNW